MTLADEVLKVLRRKADALIRRSAADLSECLDEGFLYVNARGLAFDKAQYVAGFCTSGRITFRSQTFENLQVRDFGNFATVALTVRDE